MFALGLARGDIRPGALVPERRVLIQAALIGLSLFCGNFQFVYRAESHLTSGLVAVVFALLVVPNAVFSRIFLGTVRQARYNQFHMARQLTSRNPIQQPAIVRIGKLIQGVQKQNQRSLRRCRFEMLLQFLAQRLDVRGKLAFARMPQPQFLAQTAEQ